MKNLNIIILISLFTVLACNDDFMERYPLDRINDATYWNSASDIYMYANQFYIDLELKGGLQGWTYLLRIDNNSDNQGSPTRDSYTWDSYTVPSTGGGWAKSDWLPIRKCNFALVRIADKLQSTDLIKAAEAEIHFFRAFYYFTLIRSFGDVPWIDKDLNIDSEELYKPRDSRKLVFAHVLEDLDFAITYLPEVSTNERLTKYAALAFKAEACLFEGTFRKYHSLGDHEPILREVASACESIINSGFFSIYKTGKPDQDFFDLFVQYELKGNPEGVMIQRFLKDKLMHNFTRGATAAATGYSKDYVKSYLCTDGLPISLSPLYNGDAVWGDEIVNRDPRMKQSIYTPDRPWRIYEDGRITYKKMPEFVNTGSPTSYYILKGFSPYERDYLSMQGVIDVFIYRYGEVLLNYAEAKAELGECTQEVLDKTINLLRDRVNMPHLTVDVGFVDPDWPIWEVPVTPLINEIRREQRIERSAEGIRWWDLMRWKAGKRLEDPLTYRGARDPKAGNNYKVLNPGFTRVWNDRLYLRPIPTQEIALNPLVVQNPGWE